MDFGQWIAYLSYAEQKNRSISNSSYSDEVIDLRTIYSSFLSHFPASASAWIRLSKLQSTPSERLATLNTAINMCKYIPSLRCEQLATLIHLGSHQYDVAAEMSEGLSILIRSTRDALLHVGAHPDSRELWNLVIDSEIIPTGEIKTFMALTLPRFSNDLFLRIQKTSPDTDRPQSADPDPAAVVAAAEAVWAACSSFEAALLVQEFYGMPSGNASKTAFNISFFIRCVMTLFRATSCATLGTIHRFRNSRNLKATAELHGANCDGEFHSCRTGKQSPLNI
jgi:hypothetical protein